MIILLFLSSVLASLIWTLVCLELNVRKALALGIPVVRIPVSAESNLWVIIQPLVWKILDSCVAIPWCSYPDFVRFSHRNWHFLEKSRPTERFGSVWALVSPSGISLHVADPDAIVEIYSRWKDFVRPAHKYGMLAFYGPSVFTVGLDDWPRHRKAVAAPFSETLMNMVWNETLRLTQGMLQDWTTKFEAVLNLEESLRALTFNVLAATAFQEPLTSSLRPKGAETRIETYRDTLRVVLDNAILLMLIPYRHLNGILIPQGLSRIGRAAESFKLILLGMVREEEAAINRDSAASGGLLTPLVRAVGLQKALSEQSDTNEKVAARAKRGTLSADEILGNIFAINFAGHDTVLIALTFTLMLLAANTDVQEWLNEEITAVLGEDSSSKCCDWGYDQFPKLVRCRAVFFETLRLYAPITGVPKMATERAASIQVGDRLIPITPGIEVFPVLLGIQTDARYWGETSYEWRPMRWVLHPGTIGQEELLTPRKGTFFPWSDGPQNCVGRKFSIVEGVAVLARLFHQHRLRLKVDQNEREEGARKKAQDCVDDVNYNLLLRMNNPEKVGLCVEAR